MGMIANFISACEDQKRLLGNSRMLWSYHRLSFSEAAESEGAKEWKESASLASENAERLKSIAERAVGAIRNAGYDPAVLFQLTESAGSWERFTEAMREVLPALRVAEIAESEDAEPRTPSDEEIDTYYAYSAGEAYLIEKHGVAKPKQKEIHTVLKTALDNEIDREESGIRDTYELQTFKGFTEAYRRYRRKMNKLAQETHSKHTSR